MKESDYYPVGAYSDPSAPYNEPVIPEREFDVQVVQVLSKSDTVCTNRYQPEYDDETGHTYANTDDLDWEEVYKENCYTPKEIISACKTIAEWVVKSGTNRIGTIYLPQIINECDGWEVTETNVEEM